MIGTSKKKNGGLLFMILICLLVGVICGTIVSIMNSTVQVDIEQRDTISALKYLVIYYILNFF